MEQLEQFNPEIQKQELIKECAAKAGELFKQDMEGPQCDRAKVYQRNILRLVNWRTGFIKRKKTSTSEKLEMLAEKTREKNPNYGIEDARAFIMTNDSAYSKVADYDGRMNELSREYLKFMGALHSSVMYRGNERFRHAMPDNLTTDVLEKALDYMNSRLGK